MKNGSFRVLDRDQVINQNLFIEASAGTGKTFAIENIVVRLLVEQGLHIENILVVTFTRAATRDLIERIRINIESAITCLDGDNPSPSTPDYLTAIPDKRQAKRRLERALLSFDQAPIFTIHSFCARLLNENIFEGNVRIDAIAPDQPLSRSKIFPIIHDFFRTEVTSEKYSEGELHSVLNKHRGQFEKLERALLDVIARGIALEEPPSLVHQLENFQAAMAYLKKTYALDSEKVMQFFYSQASSYTGLCNRQRQVKPDIVERITHFAQLFDKKEWTREDFDWLIRDQLFLSKVFDPENVKAKATPPSRRLIDVFEQKLIPLIHPLMVFARMAHECQQFVQKYLDQEEFFGFDDILRIMQKALENASFSQNIQKKYKAVIVDEFQDTDPRQWDIFSRLFLPLRDTYLYLVGDPKQSIYGFRQADLQTYFSAGDSISAHVTLDNNYRSHPALIKALNLLFRACSFSHQHMPYRDVSSPSDMKVDALKDEKGAVHFFVATDNQATQISLEKLEKKYFFPFLLKEMQRLHQEEGVLYDEMALLVADRYQGARAAAFLKKGNIPTKGKREEGNLATSLACVALKELLEATLHPHDESMLKKALGGKIIRWTLEQVQQLDETKMLEKVTLQFQSLKKRFLTAGFAPFFQDLMESCWHEDTVTVLERLVSSEDRESFVKDLQQIVDLLLKHQNQENFSFFLAFLEKEMQRLSFDEDESIHRMASHQGVNILTTHASKGLEFSIVFTLGLVKRSPSIDTLIPCWRDGHRVLRAVVDKKEQDYENYCREVDAEKMRQLYVAMTRAKIRVYNAVIEAPRVKKARMGCASPMELFLEKNNPLLFLEQGNLEEEGITTTFLEEAAPVFLEPAPLSSTALVPPPRVKISGGDILLHSFTSLSRPNILHDSSFEPPTDFSCSTKTVHTLPAGSETGILLHKCLELFPFSSPKMILPFLIGTPYEAWWQVIWEIVNNAIHTPLETFCFAAVDPNDCFFETSFLYPYRNENNPHYLKGVIDVCFAHEGKYYLLDWKSNWLGAHIDDYHPQNLERAMKAHDYFLQARIYAEALEKYLSIVDPRPFENIFGGVYYLFLRGINPDYGNQYGVFRAL